LRHVEYDYAQKARNKKPLAIPAVFVFASNELKAQNCLLSATREVLDGAMRYPAARSRSQ
jgi:hypothetical protein